MALCILAAVATVLPVGNPADGNTIVSTSQKKLNMRLGPGTGYGIVSQLQPESDAWVIDVSDAAKGWVKISTGSAEGYVSTEFIRSKNGNDYIDWARNYTAPAAESKKKSVNLDLSGFTGAFVSFFIGVMNSQWWLILLCCGVVLVGEILLIRFLKEEYRFYRAPGMLYGIIAGAFVLNLCVLAMFPGTEAGGRNACIVWLLLAMCVFPLLVHSCWRLEQNGKIDNKYYRSNTSCGRIGKYLGIFSWLIMGLPICRAIYGITNYSLLGVFPIPDKFWPLVFTLLVISAINFAIAWYWDVVLARIFHVVSNFIVYLLTIAFFFIIFMAELDVLNSFYGFYYILALFGMLFSVAAASGAISSIRRYRCANCHYFSGSLSGVTDHGEHTSSSDSWHDISSSSIKSSREVRNARELRRTWTTTHSWTDHMRCDYCGGSWDIDDSRVVNTETQALKRKWEEWS